MLAIIAWPLTKESREFYPTFGEGIKEQKSAGLRLPLSPSCKWVCSGALLILLGIVVAQLRDE